MSMCPYPYLTNPSPTIHTLLYPNYDSFPRVSQPTLLTLFGDMNMKQAEATVISDKALILDKVKATIGVEEVNRRVRGAIVGAMVANRSPAVYYAGPSPSE